MPDASSDREPASPFTEPTHARSVRGQLPRTLISWLRIYLYLLPLAALVTYYALVASTGVVRTSADLAHVGFGWPFDWVKQDLSRYEPIAYPESIDYNFTRAWHDPIETHYDWVMFAVNTLILGVGVVIVFAILVALLNRTRTSKKSPG